MLIRLLNKFVISWGMMMNNIKMFEDLCGYDIEELDGAEIIEEGDWVTEYKDFATKETIFKYEDNFYKMTATRSGSYYTDYDYDEPEFCEVVPRQITKTIYEVVKNPE
jgi:hypothetical protein